MEHLLILACIGLALIYCVRRLARTLTRKQPCCGCAGCGVAPQTDCAHCASAGSGTPPGRPLSGRENPR